MQLNFGVDESYRLTVPTTGDPLYAQIEVSKCSLSSVENNNILGMTPEA
jgi:hypothetical protein